MNTKDTQRKGKKRKKINIQHTSVILRNLFNYQVQKNKMRITKLWRSKPFTKIGVAIFQLSMLSHCPDGCKVCTELHLLGWKMAQADTVWLCEQRTPHAPSLYSCLSLQTHSHYHCVQSRKTAASWVSQRSPGGSHRGTVLHCVSTTDVLQWPTFIQLCDAPGADL